MNKKFENWLDPILAENSFDSVRAFNFNLYEDCIDNNLVFSVQLIGAPSYDSCNSDWACKEVFSTGENLFQISDCNDWKVCLMVFDKIIKNYLKNGKFANVLLESVAVTYGFVDGDLEVAYQSDNNAQ